MDFFDKLGKKASEAYKITADKTGKIAKEAKLRMKIGDLKSQINDIYTEIGKKVYENHVKEEKEDLEKLLAEECVKIDVLSDEIEDKLQQCLDLKDKKVCPNCYKEIDKKMKFCPECGAKQEEQEVKQVEVIDLPKDTTETINDDEKNHEESEEVEEDTNNLENDSKILSEDIENDEDETNKNSDSNIVKTVQVESNSQISENGEEPSEEDIKNLYREEDKYENS